MQKDITLEVNHEEFTVVGLGLLNFELYSGDEGAIH
jgi:hypothetical protein